MKENLENIKNEASQLLEKAKTVSELENWKVETLGKNSKLTQILKEIGKLPAAERPEMGQFVNQIKNELQEKFAAKELELKQKELAEKLTKVQIDLTLPPQSLPAGTKHPLSQIMKEVSNIFTRIGFSVETGPDIETEYYNFEALNIPANHPARDMHDTFYFQNKKLLRTHTSPVQIRVMEKIKPPIKIIVPGTVYRCDSDVTHSPVFHQVEGLYVDKGVTFAHLKGTLEFFLHELFGKEKKVRFRPSYFPFTEPSAEVDVECVMCNGKGCGVCKQTGWLEILGAGMVNRNVLRYGKVDPDEYSGFAFGLGIERIAMLSYSINDIRLFYEDDMRFLRQF